MRALLKWCAALALGCGPDKGGDEASAPGSTGPASDGSSAGGGTSTGSTGAAGPPTGTGDATGTTGATEVGTGEAGSTGEALPRAVHPLATIWGRPSALEGFARWSFDPEATCPNPPEAACGTPPVLGEPVFMIDGVPGSAADIELGDRVAVLFAYSDPACDAGCGWFNASARDAIEGENGGGSPPADLPCSTAGSNLWLALDFGVIERPGEHMGFLQLQDSCGEDSQGRVVSFVPQ